MNRTTDGAGGDGLGRARESPGKRPIRPERGSARLRKRSRGVSRFATADVVPPDRVFAAQIGLSPSRRTSSRQLNPCSRRTQPAPSREVAVSWGVSESPVVTTHVRTVRRCQPDRRFPSPSGEHVHARHCWTSPQWHPAKERPGGLGFRAFRIFRVASNYACRLTRLLSPPVLVRSLPVGARRGIDGMFPHLRPFRISIVSPEFCFFGRDGKMSSTWTAPVVAPRTRNRLRATLRVIAAATLGMTWQASPTAPAAVYIYTPIDRGIDPWTISTNWSARCPSAIPLRN